MGIFLYPFILVKFWYYDGFINLVTACFGLSLYLSRLFSLQLLVRSFLKPLKNEYRAGLVGFSIVLGIIVKSFLIVPILLILFTFLILETIFCMIYLAIPIFIILIILKN
ncbi:MAG: hypothetical protein COX79_02810 [Candidatus Levybacteria bacterium CG_4_10_14_0_2_um_filter_36_16]|nr:MAG: hypothetical protein AUK12_01030 [Candidatus Levybacteria bacterium CG2_30_37_29]PIR78962.1 MAG: hypothetical protein COU26_03760 [Candidatus Levybacteria bacterium CG10_big_fil_rev_8_21_14_0_10_36_30]PIZ97255.1 MAG: hypothetical protein COX79_02810 [Candidatus Levybacteria bacterium CG_4_10_14_0_2_um_filter_36_16]PJA90163.1 MAG: hypothetical protein CO136_02935 [Candidatus Levybacteria bacterium CG_4_9_14_3_um_filter_36_7]